MNNSKFNARTIAFVGMLGALSTALMMINFSLPFAPMFMKFDIADLPALFAGFFMGPLTGCLVVVIKILLKLVVQGSDTALVGEFSNVVGSCVFVLTATLIYRKNRTKNGAVAGMVVATIVVSIFLIFLNAYVNFPMYSKLYGMSMETIIGMCAAVNPYVKDTFSLMLMCVFPFNLVKHTITSIITFLIYKKTSIALRHIMHIEHEEHSA